MARYIDPNAFSNAFGRQVAQGAQMRQADEDNAFRAGQVARQDKLDKREQDRERTETQRTAFPRVGQIAAQISGIADPAQKREAFRQAITNNGTLFDTIGVPSAAALQHLETQDDNSLNDTLVKLAAFAPKAAPLEVSAGASLVAPKTDGTFESVFTAPTAPTKRSVEWKDTGDQLVPVYSDTGEDVPGLAPKPKGMTPGQNAVNPQQQAQIAASLRDDFRNDSKTFQGVADAFQRVTDSSSDPSGAGDVALLYNYLKVLDPASTVREGEFQTVGSSGGLPTQVQGFFNKMVNGKLPDQLRGDIVNRATRLYRGQEGRYKTQVLDRYAGLAKRYGVDPSEFSDPRAQVPTSSLPPTNAKGWQLHEDAQGNRAYVGPGGQFEEVQ